MIRMTARFGAMACAIGLLAASASIPAAAAPAPSTAAISVQSSAAGSIATPTDYVVIGSRRGYRGHAYRARPYARYHRRHNGVGTGVAIFGGLLLGSIIANSFRERRPDSAWRACARDYRSFDWDSGTIITYGGREVLCPYLR